MTEEPQKNTLMEEVTATLIQYGVPPYLKLVRDLLRIFKRHFFGAKKGET